MTSVDLRVELGSLDLPTPITLASGTCGYGAELEGLIDWSAVGAVFTKGLSLSPRAGNRPPRICEVPSGLLNAIGIENVGVDAFIRDKVPFLREWRRRHGGRVIANLYGTAVEEYARLAARLDGVDGVDGVEVNLSCPNVSAGALEFGRDPEGCEMVTRAVRSATGKWVAVKLTPVCDVAAVAQAVADAGADALSITNTMPAMAIDVRTRRPELGAGGGGLSGPALRPIAIKMIATARQVVRLPIVGIGGIASGADAAEHMIAGASAVQVGTATFAEPNAAGRILGELTDLLRAQGEVAARDIVGTVVG